MTHRKIGSSNGFSLLELIIVIALVGLLSITFYEGFRIALRFWKQNVQTLEGLRESRVGIHALQTRLKTATKISLVSLLSETQGYIQYTDALGAVVSIYYNSAGNQQTFGSNTLPVNSIMIKIQSAQFSPDPELLVAGISEFRLTTFMEDSSYFRIASPNNTASSLSYAAINSVKFFIRKSDGTVYQDIVDLIPSRLSFSGSLTYGKDYNGTTALSFGPNGSYLGFSLTNTTVALDGAFSGPDGVYITPRSLTVKIRNTGQYFSTIQSAIDASTSGNEILVAAKAGGYNEGVILKAGVKLLGGFEAVNWTRDIRGNPTMISTQAGIADRAVIMKTNSTIEGFYIDGVGLLQGIYANASTGVTVKQCFITNCDRPFEFSLSSGTIANNEVTGNEYGMILDDCHGALRVYRNRIYSKNQNLRPNVWIHNSENVDFRNNVVEGGYYALYVQGTIVANAQATIVNNVIGGADNIGYVSSYAKGTFFNNVVHSNQAGIFFEPNPSTDLSVKNNFIVHNLFGATAGTIILDPSNTVQAFTDNAWQNSNPYFLERRLYTLKSDSTLIDMGDSSSAYNDVYTTNGPGKGASRNDTGAYGGPQGGRVGPGARTAFAETATAFDIQTVLDQSWAGDWLILSSGSFSLSTPLSLRKNITIQGQGADTTFVTLTGAGPIFTWADDVTMEEICLTGSTAGTAIQAAGVSNVKLSNVAFSGFGNGMVLSNSTGELKNTTFFQNITGLRISNSTVKVYNSIFSTHTTALQADSGSLTGISCVFTANNANTAGTVSLTGSVNADPLFWNTSIYNFHLKKGSPAAAVNGNVSAGALEYYEYVGKAVSRSIVSTIYTAYKRLKITVFGDAGTYPTVTGATSRLDIAVLSNGRSVTLNPGVEFNSNLKTTIERTLPSTFISKDFQIRVQLSSFRYGSTPYVNDIEASW
jgi:prepilin-type N-terminal cleavage/methylation domain-containing protein